MNISSFYPVLATNDVAATAAFYRSHFGFDTSFESDWYVSLKLDTWELAILQADHPTIPEQFRNKAASGMLLNIEVPDVDSLYERLVASGLNPVLPLRSEEFGQRHAIFAGPDAVLIDIITPIQPSEEYLAQFSAEALEEAQGGAS
ncbi:VOC family protein [Microbacterium shaanxiense]